MVIKTIFLQSIYWSHQKLYGSFIYHGECIFQNKDLKGWEATNGGASTKKAAPKSFIMFAIFSLLKRDSNTGVFLWTLRNFSEDLFWRKSFEYFTQKKLSHFLKKKASIIYWKNQSANKSIHSNPPVLNGRLPFWEVGSRPSVWSRNLPFWGKYLQVFNFF